MDQVGGGETLTVENQEGLEFLRRAQETTTDPESCIAARGALNDRLTRVELELEHTKVELEHTKERVHTLERESAACGLSRMRFISTFKKDHLPDQFDRTFKDSETIRAGNRQPHDPDPFADADLYMRHWRDDYEAFGVLYSFSQLRVPSFRRMSHLIPPHVHN